MVFVVAVRLSGAIRRSPFNKFNKLMPFIHELYSYLCLIPLKIGHKKQFF